MFSAATSWLKTAASGLPFQLGAPIEYGDHPVWTSLREGKLTEDGSAVVVFVCEAKAGDARLELAKHAVQKAQTLRHPTVLHVRSSHETTTAVYLAAEPVVPLSAALAKARGAEKAEGIAWGVSQLCDAVDFLGKSGLIHGNIGAHSIFVTASGDWKLSGLELLSKVEEIQSHLRPHHATFDRRYQAPEIQGSEWSIVEPGATDTWSLGCVLFEAFDGNFAGTGDLKRTSSIPPALLRDYKRLCQQDPARRITPSALKEGAFFQGSTTVAVCSFLELLPVKDNQERIEFFTSVADKLTNLPPGCAAHKVLPGLAIAVDQAEPNSAHVFLRPALQIGKTLGDDAFKEVWGLFPDESGLCSAFWGCVWSVLSH